MEHLEAQNSMGNQTVLCRVCLRHETPAADICDELRVSPSGPAIMLAELLYDWLKVKFNHSQLLPSKICQNCYSKMKEHRDFCETVQIGESELQNWLQKAEQCNMRSWADQTPGLNGDPGVFKPGPEFSIIKVDPEQGNESSEDESVMDSDSNDEDISITLPPRPTNVSEQPSQPPPDSDLPWTMSPSPPPASDEVKLAAIIKNLFLCQFCEKAFATDTECKQHESCHDRAAPYNCILCSVRTNSRPFLISHMRERHNIERPFICPVCHRGFNGRSELRKHTIIHTGVKRFTCPVCNKCFMRNSNLKKHNVIHKSAKPHVCPLCPRSFSTVREMNDHAGTHASGKPFNCSRCPAGYTRRFKLRRHEMTHHSHASNSSKDADSQVTSPTTTKEKPRSLSNNADAVGTSVTDTKEEP